MRISNDLADCAAPAPQWRVIDEIDLAGIVAAHAMTDRLCARLESCADRLPERPDPAETHALCMELQGRLLGHIEQEAQLLDALFAPDMADPICHALLDHIANRHAACATQAHDLIGALMPDASGRRPLCAEAFGYTLRSFFEGCRAAMPFEELAILMLADKRLTPAAREMLRLRLETSCG
jgi:hypothetical protein